MKKVILFILAAMMILSAVGCDSQEVEKTNEVIETMDDTSSREPAIDESKTEETEKPIEEVKETEAPVVDENKLIDNEGCMYEVNQTYTFPNSELTIKRVKLKRKYDGYEMFFDFEVKNTSDKEISWRIQEHDNVIGFITAGGLKDERIGGNSQIDDEDFTSKRIIYSTYSLEPNEINSCYKLGLFNDYTTNILEPVDLKETDKITITIYYKENNNKYPIEIKLNQ